MPGKTWLRWLPTAWADEAALPLLGALMWAAWTSVPIAAILSYTTTGQATPSAANAGPAVLLLLLGGTLLARLRGDGQRSRWLGLLVGLAAVLAAVWWLLYSPAYAFWNLGWVATLAEQAAQLAPGPLLAVFIAALLWRYGMTASWKSHDGLSQAFVAGVAVLGLSLALTAAFAPGRVNQMVEVVLVFLVAAWAALSLAGLVDASRAAATDQRPRLNRYWVIALATVVGAILALGLVFASLVTPGAVVGWLALLGPVGDLLRLVLLGVLYVLTYVLFLVLTPLIEWLQRLLGNPNPTPLVLQSPLANPLSNQPAAAAGLPPLVEALLRGLTVVGLLLAVGLIVAWALRQQSGTDEAGVRENRELIWSWDLLRAQLAGLLARQPRLPLFSDLAGNINDPLLWVRRAYRRVLSAALARGYARQPRQTPHDYLANLDRLWPSEAEALAALTEAYTAARYGQVPPSAEELAALQAAVERITLEERGRSGAKER